MNPLSSAPIDWSQWQPQIRTTLLFLIQQDQILLIEKQRGIGAGKINGPGGKIDPGETPLQSILREVKEELLIDIKDPNKKGELSFHMTEMPHIHCHVYTATNYTGIPTTTPEAIPRWTKIDQVPYHLMWEDDQYWLPQLIKGDYIDGHFCFHGESLIWRNVKASSIEK